MTNEELDAFGRMIKSVTEKVVTETLDVQLAELADRVKRQILHELTETAFRDLVRDEIARRVTVYVEVGDYVSPKTAN